MKEKYYLVAQCIYQSGNDGYPFPQSEVANRLNGLEFLLERSLQQLEYYQEVDGACDHSVGICSCELREVVRAIKEALGDDNNS